MTVFWTDFAKAMLREIHAYYAEHASEAVALRIVVGIVSDTEKLATDPQIGQREELLADRPQGFRYLVHSNYKVIYWLNTDASRVEVTDVFYTRQNPTKMVRGK